VVVAAVVVEVDVEVEVVVEVVVELDVVVVEVEGDEVEGPFAGGGGAVLGRGVCKLIGVAGVVGAEVGEAGGFPVGVLGRGVESEEPLVVVAEVDVTAILGAGLGTLAVVVVDAVAVLVVVVDVTAVVLDTVVDDVMVVVVVVVVVVDVVVVVVDVVVVVAGVVVADVVVAVVAAVVVGAVDVVVATDVLEAKFPLLFVVLFFGVHNFSIHSCNFLSLFL